jgi:hypothetical protein
MRPRGIPSLVVPHGRTAPGAKMWCPQLALSLERGQWLVCTNSQCQAARSACASWASLAHFAAHTHDRLKQPARLTDVAPRAHCGSDCVGDLRALARARMRVMRVRIMGSA